MTIPNGFAMGFDISTVTTHYFNSTVVLQGGGSSSSLTIGAGGRNSTQGLICTIDAPSNAAMVVGVKTYTTAYGTVYQTFPFKINQLPLSTHSVIVCALRDVGTTQVDVRLLSDGHLQVTRAGTVLGTSTFILSINVFYHFEIKATIHNSTGVIDVLANGVSIFGGALTGLDTQNTANATVSEFYVGLAYQNSGFTGTDMIAIFDDVITNDANYTGDCRVREDLPTGTGTTDDGVPTGAADSRQATDEAPPDDDTSYTELQNVGDKVLLTYATIPTTEVVVAAGLMPYTKKNGAGTSTFKVNFRIGGVEYLPGSDQAPSAGSYAFFPEYQAVSPATAVDFTTTEFNAMEIGIERTA